MHMSFWWDTKFEILFNGFSITSLSGLICTCLGFASLAIIFESLRVIKALIECNQFLKFERKSRNPPRACPSEESSLLKNHLQSKPSKMNLTLRAFTFFSQEIIAFILMLLVMSYNGYLIISIIFGSTLGYFFFAPKKQFIYENKILNESQMRGCCPRCYDYKSIVSNETI